MNHEIPPGWHLSPDDIDAVAYGIAKLFHTPLDQLKLEADAHRRGESQMMNQHDYVGADVSYRNVASQAVTSAYHQRPSTALGYLRTGIHQKVYLFDTLDDAHAWYDTTHQDPGHDYAAVFAGTNLHVPVVEDFGSSPVVSGHDTDVGNWFLPFALGLPAGGLGGYYYRKWQEAHPGKIIPWISGEADVGAWPWYGIQDVDGQRFYRRGPWLEVGADPDATRRQAYPKTKALIQSAIYEVVTSLDPYYPAEAYVWSLEAPSMPSRPGVELYGTTTIVPFSSHEQALDYMRDRIRTDHVALALFDRRSPHWPNPVGWNKSNDPSHEPVIAQQIAKYPPAQGAERHLLSARAAGEISELVGAGPWHTIIGAAIDVLRRQAQVAAEEMPGRVIGVRRDAQNQWMLKSFHDADTADDWFGLVTREPSLFTYAAYFDKGDPTFPHPLNEAIGQARAPSGPGSAIPRVIAGRGGQNIQSP